ncbi:MAG: spore coat protein U domain-containing protein [Deltaproteobacteria bacterium]|nr:spore coat protein U domain-containing protein [Deltaproteobacteria bacterium]
MKSPLYALCLLSALLPARALALSCMVSVATPVSFGTYEVTSPTDLDTAGEILIHCKGVAEADTITVDLSTGSSGTYTPRELAGGGDVLEYNLYLDSMYTIVWGDGSGVTECYGPAKPEDGDTTLYVFGRVPAGQAVAAGSYDDTIVVTVNF